MASKAEATARNLCAEVYRRTGGWPMRWVMIKAVSPVLGLGEAAAIAAARAAAERGWLMIEGEPPHSVCLTDAGRRVVTPTTRS